MLNFRQNKNAEFAGYNFFWFFINTIWRQILTKFWFLTRFSNYKFTSKQRETANLLVFMSKFKIEFKSRLHCKDKYDDECIIKTLFYYCGLTHIPGNTLAQFWDRILWIKIVYCQFKFKLPNRFKSKTLTL